LYSRDKKRDIKWWFVDMYFMVSFDQYTITLSKVVGRTRYICLRNTYSFLAFIEANVCFPVNSYFGSTFILDLMVPRSMSADFHHSVVDRCFLHLYLWNQWAFQNKSDGNATLMICYIALEYKMAISIS
jgi:hypothetical protein